MYRSCNNVTQASGRRSWQVGGDDPVQGTSHLRLRRAEKVFSCTLLLFHVTQEQPVSYPFGSYRSKVDVLLQVACPLHDPERCERNIITRNNKLHERAETDSLSLQFQVEPVSSSLIASNSSGLPPPTMCVPSPLPSNQRLLLCQLGRFSGSSSSFLQPRRHPPPCRQAVPAHFMHRAYSGHRAPLRFLPAENSANV